MIRNGPVPISSRGDLPPWLSAGAKKCLEAARALAQHQGGVKQEESRVRAIAAAKLIGPFAIALLLTLAHVDPSRAREPALAAIVPIDLPDGQVGHMRLFHGDGVYVADPVRLIVLDAAGHLVGYSHESFPISIICSAERKCVGYDHADGVIFEFHPTEQYLGPVITDGLSAGLWFGPRDVTANMRMRAPTWSEFAAANLQMAKGSYTDIIFVVIAGIVMGILGLALRRYGVRGGSGFFVRFMTWIAVLDLEFAMLVLSAWPAYIGAISNFLWLTSLCLGALCVFGVWLALRLLNRSRRQPANA